MRKQLFLVIMFLPGALNAQFVDDFGNGNFTEDPEWVGNHDKFVVENNVLRLDDDAAGVAWLSTRNEMIGETQWDFWVRIAFVPSDNNHPRVYLVSNKADLTGSVRGYYLQIGKTGTDNKRLYFCRQDNDAHTILMSGSINLAAATNNMLRIRVTRDQHGHWSVYADPSGGTLFILQGEVADNTHQSTNWFGIVCTYTVSNSKRFYFDDFRVGGIVPQKPPEVVRLTVHSAASLDVTFSRAVTPETAQNTNNYKVSPGIGHPVIVALDPGRPHVARLHFAGHFEKNTLYNIHISNVGSCDGQVMGDFVGAFVHYVSSRFDVVFNELMANSRPTVGLPPYDWLELYNTTSIPVDLTGWTLQHGTTQRTIPHAVIDPRDYLVLTTEAGFESLAPYGNVVAVPGLSEHALTIGGNQLLLLDMEGKIVSFVNYSGKWYRNDARATGGWSLEKIDPYNFCQEAENWKASDDTRGGTPGTTNSVRQENPNTTNPVIRQVGILDPHTIHLHFSEPMDETPLTDTGNYHICHEIGNPLSADVVTHDCKLVQLTLGKPLRHNTIHTLTAGGELTDCDGNMISGRQVPIGLPGKIEPGDVVLNEILFNPHPGGARYVEIYNRSDKPVDVWDLMLASMDTLEGVLTTVHHISDESRLMMPGDYLVLTRDSSGVKRHYLTPFPGRIIELPSMPRMTNADGVVVLATRGHTIIDMLAYTEEMHLSLLTSARGVALERINPGRPANERSSWQSAAATAGYGTPGYLNSQYVSRPSDINATLYAEPGIFFPDGDGMDDVLSIYYTIDKPGCVAHIRVFDRRGRKVKTLAHALLLGTEGVIGWDGTTGSGEKAPIGMYVIHARILSDSGAVRDFRLTAVVGGRL